MLRILSALLIACLPAYSWAEDAIDADKTGLEKIQHIIVISLENHSFDNLFGLFPGADGLEQAGKSYVQTDLSGKPYAYLPYVMKLSEKTGKPVIDERFPTNLPNRPFLIEQFVPANEKTSDLVHRFYQQQAQINHGKMDRFAAVSDAGALSMGYYDGSKTALWAYAQKYTLMDRFFHAAYGGSFLNHFWLVCACTPTFEYAPKQLKAKLDKDGQLIADGAVTPDEFAVNTLFSSQPPYPSGISKKELMPPQTMLTIGDRLSEKGINWAWYAGGWNDAQAGKAPASFQYHHQPFAYFKRYAPGTLARREHLKDESDFIEALKAGTLPAVSFYKPLGEYNLHPGYADLSSGDTHLGELLKQIEESPVWKDTVVIITFDENGGYWDHVPPPAGLGVSDRWGPGMRVPTIVMSPFARQGHVDHTTYDTTSILRLIEARYDLQPLGTRDANVANLADALQLAD